MAEAGNNTVEWHVTDREYATLENIVEQRYGQSFIEIASGNAKVAHGILEAVFGEDRIIRERSKPASEIQAFDVILSILKDPEPAEFVRRVIKDQKSIEDASKLSPVPFISFRVGT
jgi:hypothetical protein